LLTFKDARIEGLDLTTSDDIKGVMVLSAPMTREHAEILGVDYLLNGTVVREGLGNNIPLSIELQNVTLHLPMATDLGQSSTYYPDIIHKLRLSRTEDAQFEITMRAHIPAGQSQEALAFLFAVKKDAFEMAIRSRQGELFEGGTRVEMAKKDEKQDPLFSCIFCDQDMPYGDEAATTHVNEDGEVVPCTHPSATAVAAMKASRTPAVASVRQMKTL
jgi:hypothetical protein